jgi:hypothetical protein
MIDPAGDSVGGLTAVIAAVIPIVLGGVATYFRMFLPSKDDFRNRTKLKCVALREKLAAKLTLLLKHARSLEPDDALRGDGREEPDLIAEYTDETFRVFAIHSRLAVLRNLIKYAYLVLYATIVVGLVGALLGWLLPATRSWVLCAGVAMIVVQILTVLGALLASWKLDEYEDVA